MPVIGASAFDTLVRACKLSPCTTCSSACPDEGVNGHADHSSGGVWRSDRAATAGACTTSDTALLPLAQTIFAISPNLGRAVSLGTPAWIQNKPNVVTASATGASASAQLFNVAPCLFALSQQGVNVNPNLIQVSPRLLQLDAIGVQVQPELITVDPTLISIGPNGVAYSPVNINASPAFITVSPQVKVVPGSNKAPTVSAGIAIKPNPDPPTITTAAG